MPNLISASNNKQQKHPKVSSNQYLYDVSDPEDISSDLSETFKAQLEERADRYYMTMRRQFRREAQKLRRDYS